MSDQSAPGRFTVNPDSWENQSHQRINWAYGIRRLYSESHILSKSALFSISKILFTTGIESWISVKSLEVSKIESVPVVSRSHPIFCQVLKM